MSYRRLLKKRRLATWRCMGPDDRRFAAGAATLYVGLLLIFEAGLAHAWASGIQADCGCFGNLFGSASVQAAFLRNLALLAAAAFVLTREYSVYRRNAS